MLHWLLSSPASPAYTSLHRRISLGGSMTDRRQMSIACFLALLTRPEHCRPKWEGPEDPRDIASWQPPASPTVGPRPPETVEDKQLRRSLEARISGWQSPAVTNAAHADCLSPATTTGGR